VHGRTSTDVDVDDDQQRCDVVGCGRGIEILFLEMRLAELSLRSTAAETFK
jgi:hypothetical protein